MSVIGPRGAPANILKKVACTADYGYVIYASGSIAHDFVECSRQSWKSLSFQLQNVNGDIIDLNNTPVSFSIVFSISSEVM